MKHPAALTPRNPVLTSPVLPKDCITTAHTPIHTNTHNLPSNYQPNIPSACVIKCYNRCYANPSQRTTSWLLNFVVNLAKKPIYNRRRQHLFQIHVANRLFPLTDLWICICILSFFQLCYSWPRANKAVQTSSKKKRNEGRYDLTSAVYLMLTLTWLTSAHMFTVWTF